jgi:hypothetical protein
MTASAARGLAARRLRAALHAAGFVAGVAARFVQCLCEVVGLDLAVTPLHQHWLSASWSEWCYDLAIAHAPGRAGLFSIEALHQ